jgi:hypothetical protein
MRRNKEQRESDHDQMGLDDFLDHKGGSSGGGGEYLSAQWKEEGKIDVWLHPKGVFGARWSHRLFRLAKSRDGDELVVRAWNWRCMERESILNKQSYRLEDGRREMPPEICPVDLLIEWLREQVSAGKIPLTAEVFRFEPDDDDEVVVHAGGLTGQIQDGFRNKDFTREEKREIRTAGIRGDDVFRESFIPKLNYVMEVVPDDDPSACKIAIETKSLGDKLKKAIRDQREDRGDKGHPLLNPYAFRWVYDSSKEFSAKYDVKPMTSIEMSDEVRARLAEDPPSIDQVMARGNVAELRTLFEEHWCYDKVTPPWDELFRAAEEAVKGTPEGEAPTDFNYGANVQKDDEGDDEEDGDDGLYACEVCGKGSPDPLKCECGAEYDGDGNLTVDPRKKEEPKSKPMRTRGGSRAGAASKSGGGKGRGRA